MQYRLIVTTWSTNVTDWQGVDDIPTYNSSNLPTSKGTAELIAEEATIGKRQLDLIGFYGRTHKDGYQLNADGTITEASDTTYRTTYILL